MIAHRISPSWALTAALLALAVLLLLLGVGGPGQPVTHALTPDDPGTLYVSADGDCGGMTPCFDVIQDAVDAAADGDTIKVAAGTYNQINSYGGVPQVVYITRSLTLQGGYAATDWETYDPQDNVTTVDAERLGRGLYVVSGGAVAVEGLVVTGGDNGGRWPGGGGIYAHGNPLIIRDNWVTDNIARAGGSQGGGLLVWNGSTVLIENSTFYSNTAGGSGGGGLSIDCQSCSATLRGNTIDHNWAGSAGGGVYLVSPDRGDFTLVGNHIVNNEAGGWGGGVEASSYNDSIVLIGNVIEGNTAYERAGLYLGRNFSFMLEANVFRNNVAETDCGGFEVTGYNPSIIRGNLIQGNRAEGAPDGHGGGACLEGFIGVNDLRLYNNAFVDNWAFQDGSALHTGSTIVRAHLRHNTFTRNRGGPGAAAIHVYGGGLDAVDTIIAESLVGVKNEFGTATLDYTLWDGNGTDITGTVGTTNNVYGAAALAADGYHLTHLSAAIDAGVDASVTTDLDSQPRPMRDTFDIGADEFPYYAVVEPGPGGRLVYTDTQGLPTLVDVPAGAVTDTILLAFVPLPAPTHPLPPGKVWARHAFTLDACTLDGVHLPGYVFQAPMTVELHYSNADLAGVIEPSLELDTWAGDAWQDAACGAYDRQAAANWLSLPVCHLSEFALLGDPSRVYLPLVLRHAGTP